MSLTIPGPLIAALNFAGKSAITAILNHRQQVAREEILREIAKGRPWAITDDKLAMMGLRYVRAMQEGAARRNLRLLAQAMGAAASQPSIGPMGFRRHADMLATLSREEVFLLRWFIENERRATSGHLRSFDLRESRGVEWNQLMLEYSDGGYLAGPISSAAELTAYAAALTRSGWIEPLSVYGGSG